MSLEQATYMIFAFIQEGAGTLASAAGLLSAPSFAGIEVLWISQEA